MENIINQSEIKKTLLKIIKTCDILPESMYTNYNSDKNTNEPQISLENLYKFNTTNEIK